ncbi:MAG: hypothetical protein V1806_07715, partial [Pseudomonadota bacterium]
MASLSARLGSPRLAFILLCGLAVWLGLGVALAQITATAPLMRALNQGRGSVWLAGPGFGDPLLLGWLLGLALWGGLLIVNLCCCSLAWLAGRGALHNWRRGLLLLAHVLLALVILGHGASFLLGYKQSGARLLAGQELPLPDGGRIKLLEVHFQADPALLALNYRQARQAMTRAKFSRQDNWARVELTTADGRRQEGQTRYFEPLAQGSLSAHLVGFFTQ